MDTQLTAQIRKFGTRKPLPVMLKSGVLQRLSTEWNYRVQNRSRWQGSDKRYRMLCEKAAKDLNRIGISHSALSSLGAGPIVEVSIPFDKSDTGLALQAMPWEFLLGAATKLTRGAKPFVVVRHLECEPLQPHATCDLQKQFLFVGNAPGQFKSIYDFDSEIAFFKQIFDSPLNAVGAHQSAPKKDKQWEFQAEQDLSLDQLKEQLSTNPSIVHISGIDAHEGANILGLERDTSREDGLYFSNNANNEQIIQAHTLGKKLLHSSAKPLMININSYFSGSRICPILVKYGAQNSIGIQDTIDNVDLELFFANFYRIWHATGGNTLIAFAATFQDLRRRSEETQFSAVSLWSRRSLLNQTKRSRSLSDRLKQLRYSQNKSQTNDAINKLIAENSLHPARPTSKKSEDVDDSAIAIRLRPYHELNFALLHNNIPPFRKFYIQAIGHQMPMSVETEVIWQIGGHQFPFRTRHVLTEEKEDICRKIKVPLPWGFIPHFNETVRTILQVDINKILSKGRKETIESHAFEVDLLPADQWKDTAKDGPWLPSFVLPRDPAVARIIDEAQRYLIALKDDPNAGFDGYQSIQHIQKSLPIKTNVDLQVQAIWISLVHHFDLGYINPPPTYSFASQRLRRPSEIFEQGRGTCIDLALLFAACLEWIDIYPVIFLMEGHAFPGYWRSEAGHSSFRSIVGLSDEAQLAPNRMTNDVPQLAWVTKKDSYPELIERINENLLTPLETVNLTKRIGFERSKESAIKQLKLFDGQKFESLVDIVIAREKNVTPLPNCK